MSASESESGIAPDAAGGWALVALLILGVAIRAIALGGDLWHDELFTWLDLVKLPLFEIWTSYPDDNQHLVYSLAARICVVLFGESSAIVRLPALVFGVASLWATYRLGIQVTSRQTALLTTALLTFSYHHVWFSQNARGYTALLLATVLSTDLLLRALREDRVRLWVAYAAVLAFGFGAHLTMFFVAAGQGLVVLALLARAESRPPAMHALGALALGGVFTLLLHAPLLGQLVDFYTQPGTGATTADVEWKSPLWLVNEAIRSFGVSLAVGWAVGLAAAVPLGAGAWAVLRRAPAAAWMFVLPAVLGFLALAILERNLWPRFFFNSFGFIALFAMIGIERIGAVLAGSVGAPAWLSRAALIAVIAVSALTVPRNYMLPKQDYSGARDWVEAQAGPDDRIVALDLAADAFGRYYAPHFETAYSLAELEAAEASGGHTWVLYTFGGYIRAREPDLWERLEADYTEVEAFFGTLGGGAIVVRRTNEAGVPD